MARSISLPPKRPPGRPKKGSGKSKLETIKAESDLLQGTLVQDLADDSDHFDESGKQLLKFHGIYQQNDRDVREKAYSFMLRTRLPGGKLTAEQYLAHDALADRFANGTLRITTRQAFQLHGILKGELKPTLQKLNDSLVTSLAACGDVVRNVMCCPVPAAGDPVREALEETAQRISDHLTPRTPAYHDVWLEGEQVYNGREHVDVEEPIYGKTYLPRKFKIGIAPPGDNCIDVYTQDIGLVAVVEQDELKGFNVLVGGGLGMTHKKPHTFPRLADPLAFVAVEDIIEVVEQIVRIQRDHGNRKDRRQARMKYLIHRWGIDRFRTELETRLGRSLEAPAPMPPLKLELHLGWQEQADGRWMLGLSVENGRVKDEGELRLKTGLHAIIDRFRPGVRLTPNHDILLTDLHADDRTEIHRLLEAHGVPFDDRLSNARKYSMACPALPTCGLALTESERVMPSIIDQIEQELASLGLEDETLTIRMTGCPNGCARPYVADIGFVGRSLDRYTLFVGGRSDGTRLNQPLEDLVHREDLVTTLRPLFVYFKQERRDRETFGDFCNRVGLDALRVFMEPKLRPLFAAFEQEHRDGETFGEFCHRMGPEALRVYSETFEKLHHAA